MTETISQRSSSPEQRYYQWSDGILCWLLAAHILVQPAVAWYFGNDVIFAAIAAALIAAGPLISHTLPIPRMVTGCLHGVAFMAQSALLIHLANGLVEMHFHIFVFIALLIITGRMLPIICAAGTAAVHHVLFWFYLPTSLLNYDAPFEIVALHAGFVVVETAAALWITSRFQKVIRFQDNSKHIIDALVDGDIARAQSMCEDNDLGKSFNALLTLSDKRAQNMERIAEGDLKINAVVLSDQDHLGISINKMIDQLRARISSLSDMTGSLRTYSGQIDDSADVLSKGANLQLGRIKEVSETLAKLASGIEGDSERALLADEKASLAQSAGQGGLEKISDLDVAMDEIKSATTDITQILGSIEGIAFQTNLLALNAAVEAARAGRHGKGFAVVADEVRALAGRSSAAAKESAHKIAQTNERVERGLEAAEAVTTALKEITGAVSETAGLVAEIAESAQKQAQEVGSVQSGLELINEITDSSSTQIGNTSEAARLLAQSASELDDLVNSFELPVNYKPESKLDLQRPPLIEETPPKEMTIPLSSAGSSELPVQLSPKVSAPIASGSQLKTPAKAAPVPEQNAAQPAERKIKPANKAPIHKEKPQKTELKQTELKKPATLTSNPLAANKKAATPQQVQNPTAEAQAKKSAKAGNTNTKPEAKQLNAKKKTSAHKETQSPPEKTNATKIASAHLGWPEETNFDEVDPAEIIDLSDNSGRY